MKDLSTVKYYEPAEKLVQILMQKTQNNNPLFFRVLVAYYFSKVASMMRCNINTHDRGVIPVNMYAINLASSGQGKGHSTNLIEEQVIHLFREKFLEETFPAKAEKNIAKLAIKRSNKNGTDQQDEHDRALKEFEDLGVLPFSFDSGTTAAVKQMRHKLLMANAGSMNMEIDEIGSNLLGNLDVLTTYLELFDVGRIKQKLIKNTAENRRNEEIEGRTPTNMMLFGTPSKLLNGSKTEEEFYSMLETGYARRCVFGYNKQATKDLNLKAEDVYNMLTDKSSDTYLQQLAIKLCNLADKSNFGTELTISKDVTLDLIQYKIDCERLAEDFPEHQEINKAEMSHRYFKALKLAGTYAFIDGSHEITEDHLWSSIKLIEDSGKAFNQILTRDKPYIKLAKYISNVKSEVTQADLQEDLPFYKGSEAQKRDLMNLAIAYGYRNNIIIKKSINDNIEFFSGESLKETDLDKLIISYSTKLAEGYTNEFIKFKNIHKLTQAKGYHFVNHHVIDGKRDEDHCMMGFNTVVLDIDEGISIDTAKFLLSDYMYILYTTKSHTETKHRYRIILPISHELKLDRSDYKEFMNNVFDSLPFEVDRQTNQRSRKWMANEGTYYYNTGNVLDALVFIPKTKKSEENRVKIDSLQSLTNLERWFVANSSSGNRNNQLLKYSLALVDMGMDIDVIRSKVLALNDKFKDKLDETEIHSTIMHSTHRAIHKRDTGGK